MGVLASHRVIQSSAAVRGRLPTLPSSAQPRLLTRYAKTSCIAWEGTAMAWRASPFSLEVRQVKLFQNILLFFW